MHFTQLAKWCNMRAWKIQATPFLASITLEHSRNSTSGSVTKMHALIILRISDGQGVSIVPIAVIVRKSLI